MNKRISNYFFPKQKEASKTTEQAYPALYQRKDANPEKFIRLNKADGATARDTINELYTENRQLKATLYSRRIEHNATASELKALKLIALCAMGFAVVQFLNNSPEYAFGFVQEVLNCLDTHINISKYTDIISSEMLDERLGGRLVLSFSVTAALLLMHILHTCYKEIRNLCSNIFSVPGLLLIMVILLIKALPLMGRE